MVYEFSWDPEKARSNLAKHGVPFELALVVFDDPLAVTKPDSRHVDRWVTMGEVRASVLVVVHADFEVITDEGQICTRIRIISARCANRQERRAYRDER